MHKRGLDGLLLFGQESMYWLTGYDSLGYVFFQCLYVAQHGRTVLFSRPQDLAQARHTSLIDEIVLWTDREGVSPAHDLVRMLQARMKPTARLGVEWNAYGLTASKVRGLDAALEAALKDSDRAEDASDLVTRLRSVKGDEEIECVRAAAELADRAYREACRLIEPGVFDGDVLGAMHDEVFRGGGGYPANECILSSGPESVLLRHHAGRRTIEAGDPVLIEFAAPFRRYHAAILRSLALGGASERQEDMHKVCVEALETAENALQPGAAFGEVFDRQAEVFDRAGWEHHRLHSCGYGLGATFPPTWVDWPMFYSGSQVEVEPRMVLLLLMILVDHDKGCGVGVGHTVLTDEHGCERLSRAPLDLRAAESLG